MTRICLGPDPDTRSPEFRAPPGSCDCHAHVFGDPAKDPYIVDRSFTPPIATVDDYLRMLDVLGVDRGVLVQGSIHGTDNRVAMQAVQSAPARLRGVAVLGAASTDGDIRALHLSGFRGARLSTVVKGTPGFDQLKLIADKIRPYGWHLVVHVNRATELVDLAPRLMETGCRIVIDHAGRVRPEEGVQSPGYQALLSMLATGNCWVKISGQHRMSSMEYPWLDMLPIVRPLVDQYQDRVLWGTDWPHPNQYDSMQNDGDLLDALARWVPEQATLKKILVDNPSFLYEFY